MKIVTHSLAAILSVAPSGAAGARVTATSVAAPVPEAVLGPVAIEAPIVTSHVGTFGGRTVRYDAVVEPFVTSDLSGKPVAKLVAASYIAKAGDRRRPVLFVFNGGPIIAAMPLHMGMFGPKRIAAPDDITTDPASFTVVDNAYSPLDVADVVVFDPAGTGYSRVLPGVAPASQFSTAADARQLAQLVGQWLERHGRKGSPVYLVGESYGTLRAPEAAYQLRATDTPVSGLILLGQALNIIEYSQRRDNVTSYAVSLPTLAAIGWWHGKANRKGRDFDTFLREAAAFGEGEYLSVLFLGNRAPAARREAVARRLEEFTGLPADAFLKADLKVSKIQYQQSLLPGFVLNSNDARYKQSVAATDPVSGGFPRYDAATVEHFRSFLNVPATAGTYATAAPTKGNGLNDWNWDKEKSPFGDWPWVSQVRELMAADPTFRVLVGNGTYDTLTTVGAMDLLAAQSGWPRERVRTRRYDGGHMMYTVEAAAKAVNDDIHAMLGGRW